MDKLLKDVLKEQIQIKGFSFERLREQTGIAERYLTAFLDGHKEKLPATPYVRGYLMKLASVLELNAQELWENYKPELLDKSSGPHDRLPVNRYAIKTVSKSWIAAGVVGVLILGYLAINASRFLGRPNIQILSPTLETTITTANTIELLGKVSPSDKLLIGGEEIIVDEQGNFQKSYPLEPGLNVIEFSVKKFLGRETKITKQIIYESQEFFELPGNDLKNP